MQSSFIVGVSVESVFVMFHISVLLCVVRQRVKGTPLFSSGFFTIYIIQSVADICVYSIVSKHQRHCHSTVVFGTDPSVPFSVPVPCFAIPYPFRTDPTRSVPRTRSTDRTNIRTKILGDFRCKNVQKLSKRRFELLFVAYTLQKLKI